MSEEINPTPLPWKIEAGEIIGLDGTEIGTIFRTEAWYSGEAIESEDQANAAFIERAVNSHYELLAILRKFMGFRVASDPNPAWLEAEQAIAKAEVAHA